MSPVNAVDRSSSTRAGARLCFPPGEQVLKLASDTFGTEGFSGEKCSAKISSKTNRHKLSQSWVPRLNLVLAREGERAGGSLNRKNRNSSFYTHRQLPPPTVNCSGDAPRQPRKARIEVRACRRSRPEPIHDTTRMRFSPSLPPPHTYVSRSCSWRTHLRTEKNVFVPTNTTYPRGEKGDF